MKKAVGLSPAFLPPPFQSLSELDRAQALLAGSVVKFSKGELLAREGESSKDIFFINSGLIAGYQRDRVVGLHRQGYVLTAGLRSEDTFAQSVRAISPVVALAFDRVMLLDILMRNPSVTLQFLEVAIKLIQAGKETLYHIGEPNLETRLAVVLWKTAEPLPDGSRKLDSNLTQTILASFMQVTREEVNKKRKHLIASGHLFKRGEDWYLDQATPLLVSSLM